MKKSNLICKEILLGALLVLSLSSTAIVFGDSYGWNDCSLNLSTGQNSIKSLVEFNGRLYAGTGVSGGHYGAQLWNSSNGQSWTQCVLNGFGDLSNDSIESLVVYNGYICAGTYQTFSDFSRTAAELWYSNNGTDWSLRFNYSTSWNYENSFSTMTVSNGYLFIGTSSISNFNAKIVRIQSDDMMSIDGRIIYFHTDWGDSSNITTYVLANIPGRSVGPLFAGTGNTTTGAKLMVSSNDGLDWDELSSTAFAGTQNISVRSLAVFNEYLYVGTHNESLGAELWRYNFNNSTWQKCTENGFGNANNTMIKSLYEFNGYLYAGTKNEVQGAEIWRSADGLTWEKFNENGFGDSTVTEINCLLEFQNRLYAGTTAIGSAGKLYSNDCLPNVISSATVTASSYHGPIGAYTYTPDNAMDGIYGAWDVYEWASNGEMTPWIRFNLGEARTINKIVLYDRCNPVDHIADAWLYLNRGGSTVRTIHLGMFPYGGAAKEVIFDPVTVDEIYIDIVDGWGLNVGLSEVQAYYDPTVESRENLIRTGSATVTASSYHSPIGAYTYEPGSAMDGIYGAWDVYEWASDGEMDPWIRFNWSEAQTINKIVLYDRCNPVDHILDAWLYLNRGGSTVRAIHLGMFPYGGAAKEVIFDPVTVDEIYIDIVAGRGLNVGLSEVEAYYDPTVESSGNLLLSGASVVASTYHSPIGAFTYEPGNAMDGIYGAWDVYEWASDGEMDPWIRFNWSEAQTINKIVLYDRCNPVDHILDAWLYLNRGGSTVSAIHLGMFPFGGAAKEVIFDPVTVDEIYIDIVDGWGLNVGLSEVEAYYE